MSIIKKENTDSIVINNYKIIDKYGKGSFGSVYKALYLNTQIDNKGSSNNKEKYFAIKRYFENIHPELIEYEIHIINIITKEKEKVINTNPNIIDSISQIIDGFIIKNEIFTVMPHYEHNQFSDLYSKMKIIDIKSYMKSLFNALFILEEIGIIHRDIKPDNFLYNLKEKKGILIDFGLSIIENKSIFDVYENLKEINRRLKSSNKSRIGTKGFIAPEILFEINKNTTKSDIFSAGVIFYCLLSGKSSFYWDFPDLCPNSVNFEVSPLIFLLGFDVVEKFGIENSVKIYVPPIIKSKKLSYPDSDKSALDLLSKCLEIDYNKRITAKEALNHDFFIGN